MGLITSDCVAMRLPQHQKALITSGCVRQPAHTVVLCFQSVNAMDSSGLASLKSLTSELRRTHGKGLEVVVAGAKGPVRRGSAAAFRRLSPPFTAVRRRSAVAIAAFFLLICLSLRSTEKVGLGAQIRDMLHASGASAAPVTGPALPGGWVENNRQKRERRAAAVAEAVASAAGEERRFGDFVGSALETELDGGTAQPADPGPAEVRSPRAAGPPAGEGGGGTAGGEVAEVDPYAAYRTAPAPGDVASPQRPLLGGGGEEEEEQDGGVVDRALLVTTSAAVSLPDTGQPAAAGGGLLRQFVTLHSAVGYGRGRGVVELF